MFENKICSRCKINKTRSQFYKQKDRKDGMAASCIECERKRCKRGTKYDYRRRNRNYKKLCGITVEYYSREHEKQNGLCLICNKKEKLVVDHCHKTNKFRGLICNQCNKGLGDFKDNFSLLIKAAHYINDHMEK